MSARMVAAGEDFVRAWRGEAERLGWLEEVVLLEAAGDDTVRAWRRGGEGAEKVEEVILDLPGCVGKSLRLTASACGLVRDTGLGRLGVDSDL